MKNTQIEALFAIFAESFPSTWKRLIGTELEHQIELWHELLGDLEPAHVFAAAKLFITADTTGFAPSIGQIRAKVRELYPRPSSILTEAEAWSVVVETTRRGFAFRPDAQAAFDKLPEAIRRALGSAGRLWDIANGDLNLSVTESQFLRSYREVVADAKFLEALTPDLRALAERNRLSLSTNTGSNTSPAANVPSVSTLDPQPQPLPHTGAHVVGPFGIRVTDWWDPIDKQAGGQI